jgi:HEAT repeat protein
MVLCAWPAACPAGRLDDQLTRRRKAEALVDELAGASQSRLDEIERELAGLGDQGMVAIKIAQLSGSFDVRKIAASMARRIRWRRVAVEEFKPFGDMVGIMAAADPQARARFVDKVAEAELAPALPFLSECLTDQQPYVRQRAIDAMVQIGKQHGPQRKTVVDALQRRLATNDHDLKLLLVNALSKLDSIDVDRLAPLLSSESWELRRTVILAMGNSEDPAMLEHVGPMLKDQRWQVRAAAAEAIAQIDSVKVIALLRPLLDDDDPFVVKVALAGLRRRNGLPGPDRLVELMDRYPDLVDVAVESLLESGGPAGIEAAYRQQPALRSHIIAGLVQQGHSRQADTQAWQSLLQTIAQTAEAPDDRRQFAELLLRRHPLQARPFVTQLLNDSSAPVQDLAAGLVIRIVDAAANPVADAQRYGSMPGYMGPTMDPSLPDMVAVGQAQNDADRSPSQDSEPDLQTLQAGWHAQLGDLLDQRAEPTFVIAWYLTGQGSHGVDRLGPVLTAPVLDALIEQVGAEAALRPLLQKIPVDQVVALFEPLTADADLYAQLLGQLRYAKQSVRDHLIDADRLLHALAEADQRRREQLASMLVRGTGAPPELLASTAESAWRRVMGRLLSSDLGLARAVAVASIGESGLEPQAARAMVVEALADEDPGVRQQAVNAVAVMELSQLELEALLGPHVGDDDPKVAMVVASALVVPSLREPARLPLNARWFEYQDVSFYRRTSYQDGGNLRPPRVIDRSPAFLDAAKAQLDGVDPDNDPTEGQLVEALVLLLGQYGRWEGFEYQLARWRAQPHEPAPRSLLMALALTRDQEYLDPLRRHVGSASDPYELRNALRLVRGVRGDQARDLRRTINRRIREMR